MFQVTSFMALRTYIGTVAQRRHMQRRVLPRVSGNEQGPGGVSPTEGRKLDRYRRPFVELRNTMKAPNDLSVWSIIERLQRRLERQGLSAAAADKAVAMVISRLATSTR
jgi:hypothetical protein